MRIGLFGGTFDPIHAGHMAAAREALERFQLDRVYFIPAGWPPHKKSASPFADRLAMVALACAGTSRFVPSAVEAPVPGKPSYSISTVRQFRKQFGEDAEIYFLIGADAFLGIRTWQRWRALLEATNFIVISRPGFDLARVETVLPNHWRRRGTPLDRRGIEYRLKHRSVYIVSGVWVPISATDIRAGMVESTKQSVNGNKARAAAAKALPAAVAEYLMKTGLYA